MDNKINFLLFVTILGIYELNAQDYKQQFNELFSQKDTVGQLQVLEKWEKADSNDPELFISYFNYYFVMCKRELKIKTRAIKNLWHLCLAIHIMSRLC